jgi:transcriptional regulator with XRE-family HTH domain
VAKRESSKNAYRAFSERLISAMEEAGYSAKAGSWSRIPVEIEPLRRNAGAKSLTTARKYLEGDALPRRERLNAVAAWLRVRPEWLVNGVGPRYASEEWERAEDLPPEALAIARAWAALPPHYREPIRSWIVMASIVDALPERDKVLPPAAKDLERRERSRSK